MVVTTVVSGASTGAGSVLIGTVFLTGFFSGFAAVVFAVVLGFRDAVGRDAMGVPLWWFVSVAETLLLSPLSLQMGNRLIGMVLLP
ncbi:hypothetical protein [Celeribacter ethanolicus]|uniref:hypothetical protein n=1 Tax=Celeribacter ethanolicus TaxID=1758178 RepID=UPI00138EE514|nr:hypothetical protein [Celeribacter ethanolicus]